MPPTLGVYSSAKTSGKLAGSRTLDSIADYIRHDARLASDTTEYRRIIANGDKESGKDFKESRFPAITCAGIINGKRQGGWPDPHSGLYQFDLDKLDYPELSDTLQRATSLAYAALVFVSPSYGIKALLRGPAPTEPTTAAQHRAWIGVTRRAARDIGIEWQDADPAVKGAAGLCFLCHDPDAHYNPDATIAIPDYPPEPQRGASPAVTALEERVTDLSAIAAIPCPRKTGDGQAYNDWLGWVRRFASVGISASDIAEWCKGGGAGSCGDVGEIEAHLRNTAPDDADAARDAIRGHAYNLGWRNATPRAARGYRPGTHAQPKTGNIPPPVADFTYGNTSSLEYRAGRWFAEVHGAHYRHDRAGKTGWWGYVERLGLWQTLEKDNETLIDALQARKYQYADELRHHAQDELAAVFSTDRLWRNVRGNRSDFYSGMRDGLDAPEPGRRPGTPAGDFIYLNTPDCTVDLMRGDSHRHSPNFECRAVTAGRYDPANAPDYLKYLQSEFGKVFRPEMLLELLRIVGLTMTNRAQAYSGIVMVMGSSGSGKGGTVRTIGGSLGGYATQVPAEWFAQRHTANEIDAVTFDILERQVRFIGVDELGTDNGRAVSEKRLLTLTGDNYAKARKPYGKIIEDVVRGAVWTTCVIPPKFPANSGIKRRLIVLPTSGHFFTAADIDARHAERQDTLDAIVTLGAMRAREVYADGYEPPMGDESAKSTAVKAMDDISEWLDSLEPLEWHGKSMADALHQARADLGDDKLTSTLLGNRVRLHPHWGKHRPNPKAGMQLRYEGEDMPLI